MSRRSSRKRKRSGNLEKQPVRGDGQCLYRSVLLATKHNNIAPGNKFNKGIDKDVVDLRKAMIKYLEDGKGEVVVRFKEFLMDAKTGETLFDQVLQRVKAGYTESGNLRTPLKKKYWPGQPEIDLIKDTYKMNYVLLDKDMEKEYTTEKPLETIEITPPMIFLVFSGNHYDWARVKDWSQFQTNVSMELKTKLKF